MDDFEGKGAVVTGGASGIGRGIAEALLAEGAKVVIADIEGDRLARTAAELGVPGIVTDVANAESVASLAIESLNILGKVHIIVNNAGVGPIARCSELTLSDWRWVLGVNLWGVINGLHAFLPILRANAEGGHVVNTGSISGLSPQQGLAAYAVAKSGVIALSETLALELAEERSPVGVTVLCPGPVRTDIAHSSRNRPDDGQPRGLRDMALTDDSLHPLPWRTPEDIGALTIAAMRAKTLHAFTHPEMFGRISAQYERLCNDAGLHSTC